MIFHLFSLLFASLSVDPELRLSQPVDCELGRDCVIQQYVDHDPSDGIMDFRCGRQSYDGHKGTDFRIPNLKSMSAGVLVLAAAKGRVLNIRDGEPDMFARDRKSEDLNGKECGNGVVLDHGDGWQTQYCHLRNRSIDVRPGEEVEAGDALGLVGMSGKADFPHLHLSVRYQGKVVDPFAVGFAGASCGGTYTSLWDEKLSEDVGYKDALILNTGFWDAALDNRDIEAGAGSAFSLSDHSPALVVFARMINVIEGDYLQISIKGPGGFVVTSRSDPAPRPQAQRLAFAGKKRPKNGWSAGIYTAQVELVRGDKILERRELSIRR